MPTDEQADALAQRAGLQEDAEEGARRLRRARSKLAPDDADLRLSRAQFQFDHDDIDDALAEVAQVVDADAGQGGGVLAAGANSADAQAVRRSAQEPGQGRRSWRRDRALPAMYRGEIYREMGEFDKAIEEFTRVLELQPGMDLALIRRAEAYFFAEKFDEALADVDAVLKNNPDLAIAHGLRAQVLAAKNRLGEAIAEMKQLADDMPGQADVRMHLALYYQLNDQPQRGDSRVFGCARAGGDNFLALRSRGDAYLNIGDHGAAIADFEAALKIEPEDTALLNNLAWVLATSPDDELRDGKRAIELATKACELTEYKKPHILSTLAAAYAETGDFDKAREWSDKSIEVNRADLDEAQKKGDEDQVTELTEMGEQLEKELASYKDGKPCASGRRPRSSRRSMPRTARPKSMRRRSMRRRITRRTNTQMMLRPKNMPTPRTRTRRLRRRAMRRPMQHRTPTKSDFAAGSRVRRERPGQMRNAMRILRRLARLLECGSLPG